MNVKEANWNADNSAAQYLSARELISGLDLEGHESLLDVGCGDGRITAQLACVLKNGSALGIDLSSEMIEHARICFPSPIFPNLSFLCMDAADIRLPEKFDVAFSNAALHWIKDHIAVLRSIRACLNPGGRILFQMGGKGNAADMFDIIGQIIRKDMWKEYFRDFKPPYYFYEPLQYGSWLTQTGFRPVRVELVPKDMQHQDAAGLMGWLRTTWFPCTDRLPIGLRGNFLEDVTATYITAYPVDSSGYTHVNMVRLEVEACAI